MKKELLKKIESYSGLASCIMFLPALTDAQIIYTNPPNIALNPEDDASYSIDLNTDGIIDFEAFATDYFGNHLWAEQIYNHPWELAIYEPCFDEKIVAFPLVAGQVIHPANPHWLNDEVGYSYFNFCSLNYGTCLSHRWAGKQNRFLGVRIPVLNGPGNYYYGWVRLSVGNNCNGLLIKDWAYNSVPDQPITAGQIMLKGDNEIEKVYNDVEDYFNISSDGNKISIQYLGEHESTVKVFNSLGQLVYTNTILKNSEISFITDLNAGVYIVAMTDGNMMLTKQVIVY